MLCRTRPWAIMSRGGGKAHTRGSPIGDYGIVDVAAAGACPPHMLARARLESQKHIKSDTERPRKYTLCTRCGVANLMINFEAVPSARFGMYGTCVDGKDYTHHKFTVIGADVYRRLQDMPRERRVQWWFER